jgi:Fe-S cluster assembly iron-binding protein IscA
MLEVTDSASQAVREYLTSHGLDSAIRVTLEGGG